MYRATEKISDYWTYAPSILRRASKVKGDTVLERFKLVVAFAIAGLHRTVGMKKPFNPILGSAQCRRTCISWFRSQLYLRPSGETFQAEFPDGTQIFAEQTCHHPPISHFQVSAAGGEYGTHATTVSVQQS